MHDVPSHRSHLLTVKSTMIVAMSIKSKLVIVARDAILASGISSGPVIPSPSVVTLTVEMGPLPALLTAHIVMW